MNKEEKKLVKEIYDGYMTLWDGIPYIKEDEPHIVAVGTKLKQLLESNGCRPHDWDIDPGLGGTCKNCGDSWQYER